MTLARWIARSRHVALAATLLAACSDGAEATLPPRPSEPADWVTVQTTLNDLRLTLPPDVGAFHVEDVVFASLAPDASGRIPLEVQAVGPWTPKMRPEVGESLDAWIDRQVLGGVPPDLRSNRTSESVLLPAGRAERVSTLIGANTDDPRLVVVWAVPTDDFIGYLVLNATPKVAQERAADLQLIAELVQFQRGRGAPPGWLDVAPSGQPAPTPGITTAPAG